MFRIRLLLTAIINQFIYPGHRNRFEEKLKAQVLVSLALFLIVFNAGCFLYYRDASAVMFWNGLVHFILVILLLFIYQKTGNVSGVGSLLVLSFYLQIVVNAGFSGGLNSNAIGLLLFIPILAVVINGYLFGALCLLLVGIPVVGFQFGGTYLNYIRSYSMSILQAQTERCIFLILVIVGFSTVSLLVRLVLMDTIRSQRKEAVANKERIRELNELVADIGQSAATIISSAEQLSATSLQIQENAVEISTCETQAAASIFQSTNTIHELSASFLETANQMKELETLAIAAEDEGIFGGESVVKSHVALMNIEKSSKQIEGIIQVITEIADQTNLLSLNAAIEADKAGDYGKGFAIVAEEVGSLANRSNEAAAKIIDLIQKTNIIILEEKKVIDETGNVLEEIIQQINTITGSVHEIVINIREQEAAIQEIAKGSELISRSSERNVEIAENLVDSIVQSNKAIDSLGKIADKLESKVSAYKNQ